MPHAVISLPYYPVSALPGQKTPAADLRTYSRCVLYEAAKIFQAIETAAKDDHDGSPVTIPSYDAVLSDLEYINTVKPISRTAADRDLVWMKIKPQSVSDGHGRSIPVQLFSASRTCTTENHKEQENWFSRYSVHTQDNAQGGVTWDQFKAGLLINRAENELDYVGSVKEVRKLFEYPMLDLWAEKGTNMDHSHFPVGGVSAAIYEVVHALPPPLKRRIFPVLAITGHMDKTSWTTIQIPVDHLEELIDSDGEKLNVDTSYKKAIVARYVSIERLRLLDDGNVEWIMATASDAGGVLPGFLQKLGIPSTIAKDVGWFAQWCMDGQKKKSS